MSKRYSELILLPTFEERFHYLKLDGIVGDPTFGGHRYLNQELYRCYEWKAARREAIIRDNGCDLATPGYLIGGPIYIHHINPITIEDVLDRKPCVFDLDNLVCTSFKTHNAIHYRGAEIMSQSPVERTKNDTCPWR